MMPMISTSSGQTCFSDSRRSRASAAASSDSSRGASDGSSLQRITIIAVYTAAVSSPGSTPAMSSLMIETSANTP